MKSKEEIQKLSYDYSDKVNMSNDWTSFSIADAVTYGYNQCQEDMADKKYTEIQLRDAMEEAMAYSKLKQITQYINSLNKQY